LDVNTSVFCPPAGVPSGGAIVPPPYLQTQNFFVPRASLVGPLRSNQILSVFSPSFSTWRLEDRPRFFSARSWEPATFPPLPELCDDRRFPSLLSVTPAVRDRWDYRFFRNFFGLSFVVHFLLTWKAAQSLDWSPNCFATLSGFSSPLRRVFY